MTTIELTDAQTQKVLDENTVDPVITPPTDPIVTPLPPVEPIPDLDPTAHNMRFVNVFGSKLEFGDFRPNVYRWENIRVHKSILSMELALPVITSACMIKISKASSSLPSVGVMIAVFSYDRDFSNPLSVERWGNGALQVKLGPLDSERTLFFNVRFHGNERPWGLYIQPWAYKL